jgi:hypothetical protein
MTELGLRPRSATELVDAAFQLYKREPLQFIVALGIIYVPWMIVSALLGLDNPTEITYLSVALIAGFGGIFVYTLASGVTTVLADDVYFNRQPNIGRAFSLVGRRLFPLVVTMLASSLAIGLGLLLLLLPALYMIARYFAVVQLVMLEGLGANGSLRRTADLSKGHKRHILNTLGLVAIVNIAIGIGVSMVASMIPSTIIRLVLQTIVSTLVYPMFGITATLLYYDVRIRKEGFDIEYLAKSFEQVPVAT